MTQTRVARLALVLWALALLQVGVRVLLQPNTHTVSSTFFHAGQNWRLGRDLYAMPDPGYDLFRYSPPAAASFIPWSYLPDGPGGGRWRWLHAAGLLAGPVAVCRLAGVGPG